MTFSFRNIRVTRAYFDDTNDAATDQEIIQTSTNYEQGPH